MSYKARLRKEIALPSGATIVIHKLNAFSEAFLATKKGDDEMQRGMVRSRYMLTNPLNGPLCFKGDALRIVDKDTSGPGEITIAELEQDDADKIIEEIMSFSGLTKAGQEARKTFPEGQGESGAGASPGAVIQLPSDGPAQAAVG